IAKTLSLFFVEMILCTPIMVQVMFIFLALPLILPVRFDPITAAMVTIFCYSGADIAEFSGGAIWSFNRGFIEASLAMGLS
ncbi:glutamine ABC transporter permease, partial [Salmonella enterica subsp. enterica serovar Typhimurium]